MSRGSPTRTDERIRVFIGHSHTDAALAEQISKILSENGLQPIFCGKLEPGKSFTDNVRNLLASAHVYMPVITESSCHRAWVHQEVGYAAALGIPVLPLIVGSVSESAVDSFGMHGLRVSDADFDELRTRLSRNLIESLVSVTVEPPFEAYGGCDPFLFVSYSHQDKTNVYPEIGRLHGLEFRIWYDEGIDPGNEWPEDVASALARSSFFLVFTTPPSVESQNVRNEINFAINRKKPFLAVHLEETSLPMGLELRMGDIQAVLKWRMTEDRYHRQIEKSLPRELRTNNSDALGE